MTLLEMLNQDLNLVGKFFRVCEPSNASYTGRTKQWGQILSRSRDGMYTVEIPTEDSFEQQLVPLIDMADWQFYSAREWKRHIKVLNAEWKEITRGKFAQGAASNRAIRFLKAHPEFDYLVQAQREAEWEDRCNHEAIQAELQIARDILRNWEKLSVAQRECVLAGIPKWILEEVRKEFPAIEMAQITTKGGTQ